MGALCPHNYCIGLVLACYVNYCTGLVLLSDVMVRLCYVLYRAGSVEYSSVGFGNGVVLCRCVQYRFGLVQRSLVKVS